MEQNKSGRRRMTSRDTVFTLPKAGGDLLGGWEAHRPDEDELSGRKDENQKLDGENGELLSHNESGI